MKLTRLECLTYLCLLAVMLTPSEQVLLFEAASDNSFTEPQCDISQEIYVKEGTEVTLTCHIIGPSMLTTTDGVVYDRTDLIIWYDGDTGEVQNYNTSLTINDLGDGRQDIRLELTDSFNRTDHGRQFVCRSQVSNTICALTLNIAYNVALAMPANISENVGTTNARVVDGYEDSCTSWITSESYWWFVDLENVFAVYDIHIYIELYSDDDQHQVSVRVSMKTPSTEAITEDECASLDSIWFRSHSVRTDLTGCQAKTGRFVAIYGFAHNFLLDARLCEVVVWGNQPLDTTPTIQKVFPTYGPEAGGTLITLNGRHLIIGNDSVEVYLGDVFCEIISQEEDIIVARTPQLPSDTLLDEKLDIRVILSSGLEVEMITPFKFEYRGNPVIYSIYPLETIAPGGIKLTITGRHFDSVAQPIMVITAKNNTDTLETYYSDCNIVNPGTLICLSPTIDTYLISYNPIRAKRDVNVERERIDFYFSFLFDGVNTYSEENFAVNLPEYSQLDVIADPPAVEHWDEIMKVKPGGTLTIYAQNGEDLQRGCTVSDYTVYIGLGVCEDLVLNTNSLISNTPRKKPDPGPGSDEDGSLRVIMSIGIHKEYIGRMNYQSEGLLDDPVVMWLLVGGIVLFVVILLAVIIGCVVKKKRYPVKKPDSQSSHSTVGMTMSEFQDMRAMEASRHRGVVVHTTDKANPRQDPTPGVADQGDGHLKPANSDAYPGGYISAI